MSARTRAYWAVLALGIIWLLLTVLVGGGF